MTRFASEALHTRLIAAADGGVSRRDMRTPTNLRRICRIVRQTLPQTAPTAAGGGVIMYPVHETPAGTVTCGSGISMTAWVRSGRIRFAPKSAFVGITRCG